MTPQTDAYISLLMQIPLVGIFVWFSLVLIKIFMNHLKELNVSWQGFLEEQRKANNESIVTLTNEVKGLCTGIAEMRGTIGRSPDRK